MKKNQDLIFYSVTISVSNLEKMANWYEQKMGFTKLTKLPVQISNTRIQFIELNGFKVELIENINSKNLEKKKPPLHTEIQGMTNFCLYTKNLASIKDELIDSEIPILWCSENEALRMKMLLIEDPEHNLIQFLERI